MFQEKDYLDYRYFYKRACYLASLAAGIKSSHLPVSMDFEHLHGDERKPVLILSSLHGMSTFSIGFNMQTGVNTISAKPMLGSVSFPLPLAIFSPSQNSHPQDATSAPLQQLSPPSTIQPSLQILHTYTS